MKFFRSAPLTGILLVSGIVFTAAAALGRNAYAGYDVNPLEKPLFSVVFQGMHDGVYPWGKKESEGEQEAQQILAEAGQESTESVPSESVTEASSQAKTEAAAQAQTEEEPVDLNVPETSSNPVVQAKDYGNNDSAYLSPEGTVYAHDTEGIFAPNGTYYDLQQVDDSYFRDAIFIGDSRTEGLYVYSSMRGKADFCAKDSVTVYGIYDTVLDFYGTDGSQTNMTAMQALQNKQYRKVYFSVGINELGMPTPDYFQHYKEFVEVIRQLQPDAIIYVEGIMHVTGSYAQNNSVYNNVNVVDKNTALASLSNGRDIIYIDMNSAVCDADGNVPEEISYDGIHLKASAYEKWHEFLLENAIVRDAADWQEPAQASEASTEEVSAGADTAGEIQQ